LGPLFGGPLRDLGTGHSPGNLRRTSPLALVHWLLVSGGPPAAGELVHRRFHSGTAAGLGSAPLLALWFEVEAWQTDRQTARKPPDRHTKALARLASPKRPVAMTQQSGQ